MNSACLSPLSLQPDSVDQWWSWVVDSLGAPAAWHTSRHLHSSLEREGLTVEEVALLLSARLWKFTARPCLDVNGRPRASTVASARACLPPVPSQCTVPSTSAAACSKSSCQVQTESHPLHDPH